MKRMMYYLTGLATLLLITGIHIFGITIIVVIYHEICFSVIVSYAGSPAAWGIYVLIILTYLNHVTRSILSMEFKKYHER